MDMVGTPRARGGRCGEKIVCPARRRIQRKTARPPFAHFGLYKSSADVISRPLHHDTLPLRRRPGNAGPVRFAATDRGAWSLAVGREFGGRVRFPAPERLRVKG